MAQKRKTFTFSSSSSNFTSSVDSSTGSKKPGCAQGPARTLRRHPPVLNMVLEALQARRHPRGTSVAAIKIYILHNYPSVDMIRLKYLLKQALATGVSRGLLTRPAHSKAKGATGSFKLVPKPKSKVQSKKTHPKTASRNPEGATGQGPKRPDKAKKDLPNQGQAKGNTKKTDKGKMVQAKRGTAKEKAPLKANTTKKNLPKPGKVKNGVQKPQGVKAAQPKESTVKEKPPKNSCQIIRPQAKATVRPKTIRKAPTSGKPKAMGGKSKPVLPEVNPSLCSLPSLTDTKAKNQSSKPKVTKTKSQSSKPKVTKTKSQSPKPKVTKSEQGTVTPSRKKAKVKTLKAGTALPPPKDSGAQQEAANAPLTR